MGLQGGRDDALLGLPERTLRRLEQYMKQGMSKDDALQRLGESLESPHTGPANPGALAIMGIDD